MIKGINHLTLAVSDLSVSLKFYCDLLGCKKIHEWREGAYVTAGDIWICLSVDNVDSARNDYTHIAFDVDTGSFLKLKQVFVNQNIVQWKENHSEGSSVYFLDPDGHQLELHVGTLESRMQYIKNLSVDKHGCGADA